MRQYLIPILLIAGVLLFIFAIFNYIQETSPKPTYSKISETINNTNPLQDDDTKPNNSHDQIDSNEEIVINQSILDNISSGGNPNLKPNVTIPLDINNSGCGTYYESLNICAGTCREGKCISENGSCYCKIV
jgi:hypothetical protein